MRRSRRHFLQVAAAGVLTHVMPIAPAQAQWLGPVSRALNIIFTALNIASLLAPWFYSLTADKRCSIDIGDLENIKIDCDVLEQSLDDEGRGAIPTLQIFLANKDNHSWKEVKISISQLLADGIVLMGNINRVVASLNPTTYQASKNDIERLYRGVDDIRAAMVVLARLPENPEPEDFKLAENVLGAIRTLPDLAKTAASKIQIAIDDRRKLKC